MKKILIAIVIILTSVTLPNIALADKDPDGATLSNAELIELENKFLAMDLNALNKELNELVHQDAMNSWDTYNILLGNRKTKGLLAIALDKIYEHRKNGGDEKIVGTALDNIALAMHLIVTKEKTQGKNREEKLFEISIEYFEADSRFDNNEQHKAEFLFAMYEKIAYDYSGTYISDNDPEYVSKVKQAVIDKLLIKSTTGILELSLMFNEYLDLPLTIINNYSRTRSVNDYMAVLLLKRYLDIVEHEIMNKSSLTGNKQKTYTFEERLIKRSFFVKQKSFVGFSYKMSSFTYSKLMAEDIIRKARDRGFYEYSESARKKADKINTIQLKDTWNSTVTEKLQTTEMLDDLTQGLLEEKDPKDIIAAKPELYSEYNTSGLINKAASTYDIAIARNYLSQALLIIDNMSGDVSYLRKNLAWAEKKINERPLKLLSKRIKAALNTTYETEIENIIYALDYITNDLNGDLSNKNIGEIALGTPLQESNDGLILAVQNNIDKFKNAEQIETLLDKLRIEILGNNEFLTYGGVTMRTEALLTGVLYIGFTKRLMGYEGSKLKPLTSLSFKNQALELKSKPEILNKCLERLQIIEKVIK